MLAILLAAVLSACSAPVVPPQGATAFWKCGYGSGAYRAWVLTDPDDVFAGGIVEANGIRKISLYQEQGLSHRWNFDPDEDGRYTAAFVIDPDGVGSYYVFREGESTAKPRDSTQCTKHL